MLGDLRAQLVWKRVEHENALNVGGFVLGLCGQVYVFLYLMSKHIDRI